MRAKADDAQVYRMRASEMRKRASRMKDRENKKMMLSVAEGYDYLADMIDNPDERSNSSAIH